MQTEPDRRRQPRVALRRPVKVFHRGRLSFAAGESVNLSAGGAFVEVRHAAPIEAGDRVAVLICADHDRGLASSGALVDAQVVRTETGGAGAQRLAIRYEDRYSGRLAA